MTLTALSLLLVVIQIQRPSYWVDEKISVDAATGRTPRHIVTNVIKAERRPPAYQPHLLQWQILRLFAQGNALTNLGIFTSALVVLSDIQSQLFPYRQRCL